MTPHRELVDQILTIVEPIFTDEQLDEDEAFSLASQIETIIDQRVNEATSRLRAALIVILDKHRKPSIMSRTCDCEGCTIGMKLVCGDN